MKLEGSNPFARSTLNINHLRFKRVDLQHIHLSTFI